MLNSSGYFENPYFSEKELECRGSEEMYLAPGFLGMLVHLRTVWKEPMIVNSCCRSSEYNKAIGGHPKSLHLTDNTDRSIIGTMAIDISTADMKDHDIEVLHALAGDLGWSVGRADTFIHLDARILLGRSRADFTY